MTTNRLSLQNSIRQWIDLDHWNHPFGITLTLKQRVWIDNDRGRHGVTLTPEDGSRNLRHFLNVLNKQVYGSSSRRFGKQLPVIPVLEGGGTKRLHYHLVMDCPRDDLIEVFPSMVVQTWRKTVWGYDQTHITPCDKGWVSYITKFRDKPDFGSSIDWLNCHNPH